MILSVHQPQYLPWLGFFDKIAQSDAFVYLDCVQYKEREFQNRNKIRTQDGWMWLTVPVITKGRHTQEIRDVEIDNEHPWLRQHFKSLEVWYASSLSLKEHKAFFEDVFNRKWEKLSLLNVCITEYLLKQFAISTPVYFESQIGSTSKSSDRIVELCQKLKADTYFSGAGGKEYLEEKKFKDSGINLVYQHYEHPAYRQQFMSKPEDFLPYMSAIDLLFNEGERAKKILSGIGSDS